MESLAPVLVTMVMLSVILIIALVSMFLRFKAQDRLHRERMLLAEKGLPIPPELLAPPPRTNGDMRKARAWLLVLGVTLLFAGVAAMIAIGVEDGARASVRGIAPLAIGLAFIAAERVLVKVLLKPEGSR